MASVAGGGAEPVTGLAQLGGWFMAREALGKLWWRLLELTWAVAEASSDPCSA